VTYSNSGVIGTGDADILVALADGHGPTDEYVRELRKRLPEEFPGTTFSFLPADIVSQILNFGLPAPIDVQVVGSSPENRELANRCCRTCARSQDSSTCGSSSSSTSRSCA
jgi:hypothetical protein